MNGAYSSHELTYLMDNIWDIKPSDNKVDKIANKMLIQSKITKTFSILGIGASIKFNQCVGDLIAYEIGTQKHIRGVLGSYQIITIKIR